MTSQTTRSMSSPCRLSWGRCVGWWGSWASSSSSPCCTNCTNAATPATSAHRVTTGRASPLFLFLSYPLSHTHYLSPHSLTHPLSLSLSLSHLYSLIHSLSNSIILSLFLFLTHSLLQIFLHSLSFWIYM